MKSDQSSSEGELFASSVFCCCSFSFFPSRVPSGFGMGGTRHICNYVHPLVLSCFNDIIIILLRPKAVVSHPVQ